MGPLKRHWPEYLMEAAGLGIFMISASLFAVAIHHPASPLRQMVGEPVIRRMLMGAAMGGTLICLVYSPWGRQSGAHLNPSVTLTFLRLGKIRPADALGYVIAQFAGGLTGLSLAALALGGLLSAPEIRYIATLPGAGGSSLAFAAETAISFLMMFTVLLVSNTRRLSPFTGFFAAALVASSITLEDPFSGMSMNPARSFAPALWAGLWETLWIYFTAPPLGMLLAAQCYLALRGARTVHCAKLDHHTDRRCIFRCNYRELVAACGLFVALWLPARLPAAEPDKSAAVEGVESVGLSVSDLDRSIRFFCEVLTFEKVSGAEVAGEDYERLEGLFGLRLRTARLRLGEEFLDLTECLAPRGRPVPADSRSNDRWFQHVAITVRDMDQAYRRLRQHRVEHASSGPQRLPDWNPNAGGIRAFYFKDPDGHPLEVLEFPPDKGDPKWRRPGDALFLGIDHTAIVVSDTDASVALYRRLGFRVAGESENHGTEQEHLNNVFGARLRITAVRAASGPGIELLEYLSPPGGRPALADARVNDLVSTRTRLLARGPAEEAAAIISSARLPFVSPGVVSLPGSRLGFPRGVVVRDPDGHALLIVERENVERNSEP